MSLDIIGECNLLMRDLQAKCGPGFWQAAFNVMAISRDNA